MLGQGKKKADTRRLSPALGKFMNSRNTIHVNSNITIYMNSKLPSKLIYESDLILDSHARVRKATITTIGICASRCGAD